MSVWKSLLQTAIHAPSPHNVQPWRVRILSDERADLAPPELLHQVFFEGLGRVNQDFREVTRMFDRKCVEIEIYGFEQGPFSERDIRIKNKYVAQ